MGMDISIDGKPDAVFSGRGGWWLSVNYLDDITEEDLAIAARLGWLRRLGAPANDQNEPDSPLNEGVELQAPVG